MIGNTSSDSLRVLVIDTSHVLVDDVDYGSRSWPHRVSCVDDWADAVNKSARFKPAIVCAPVPCSGSDEEVWHTLRAQHADVPMIGYAESDADRNRLLRTGVVDIAVHPSELTRPSVTELLRHAIVLHKSRVGESSGWHNHFAMQLRRSRMIGSVVTTAAGVVQCANKCITRWLGYPDANYLVGVNFACRHLKRSSDWTDLAKAAGDKDALIQTEVSALDVDHRWIALRVEVSAEPACLPLLRLLFLDDTQEQLHRAAADLAFRKANDSHPAVQ